MEMKVGAPFKFVWRNDELNNPPSKRPDSFPEEHSLESRITELDPPRKLAITWGSSGGVSFELEPKGNKVLLTLIHRRLPDRATLLMVSAGWHMHLDILVGATGRAGTLLGRLEPPAEGIRPALAPDRLTSNQTGDDDEQSQLHIALRSINRKSPLPLKCSWMVVRRN
jgi:hypothetical protein